MTNALLRTPKGFFTSFGGGRDGTLPIHFGQLKMTTARKPYGGWLSASFNGGLLKISNLSAKAEAERNCGGNGLVVGGLSDEDPNLNAFDYDNVVNIWWDFGRCPLPLNFDASKIASNINKALRLLNMAGAKIYFHVYGICPGYMKDFKRFLRETGFGKKFLVERRKIKFKHDHLRSAFSRPSGSNIVISDGYGYPDSLSKDGNNIILPLKIILGEVPLESKYLEGCRSPDYIESLDIWWDAGRCPPPSNFDVSKIGITVVEFLRSFNTSPSIYFHVHGNLGELLPKMANDTIRIFSESGFKLAGLELKDNSNVSDFILAGLQRKRKYFSNVLEASLMMDDLIYHNNINHPPQYHMVVLDGKVITTSILDQLRLRDECELCYLVPQQESVHGVWRWRLWN